MILIERNLFFKKGCETSNVRDFYLIILENFKNVNFIFNNFYSLDGFKNRLIVLRDIEHMKSTFDLPIFHSKRALVSRVFY